jgi:hypothetical protein
MEHRKVLRISTIVLAMAIFSLVIAKPGMAYARSGPHLHIPGLDLLGYLGDTKDLQDIKQDSNGGYKHIPRALLGIAGSHLGDFDPTGIVGSHLHDIGHDIGDKYEKWVKHHNEEYENGGDSDHEDHGSSESDHEHSESSGESDHDFSPSGGGNGGSNSLPSEGSGGSGGGSDNGGSDNGGGSSGGDEGGGSGGGGGDEGGGSGGGGY